MQALNDRLLKSIVLSADDGGALSSLWIFRLRAVCRAFRDMLESILMDGSLLVTMIHRRLHYEIWQHHYGCLQEYTDELHEYLLKIANESKSASELCELLIDTAFDIQPVPTLKRMLMEAAAGAACTPELQGGLHALEDDDAQTRFGPLIIKPIKMAAVRKRVRAAAASILPRAGRRGIDQLNAECTEAVRRLDQCIVASLVPEDPIMSIILWAGLQWRFQVETAWLKLHCVVPDSLRYLCIRWLLATASIEPSSDFGAALKFLTEVDIAGDLGPDPGPDPDTALACMVVTVQKSRQYAAERWLNPHYPRLEHIIANFLEEEGRHNSYTLPLLIARVNGKDLMARVNGHHYLYNRMVHVGGFRCSSPDCRWWLHY